MFRIEQSTKHLSRLQSPSFSDLDMKEREDLQEWLANTPDALGEELLIIQKEYSGFEGTRERLDLLALDKNRSLVIIENKLDDSGRDVVWQAVKYAAYCSTLTKAEIITIFKDYLEEQKLDGNASEVICKFFEVDDIEEINLNRGNNQRIMFVAARFQKEVTSAVLWLRAHEINAQCMEVTPYTFDGNHFLDIRQIIPTEENQHYMIQMKSKDSEESQTQKLVRERDEMAGQFWEKALEYFKQENLSLYSKISPAPYRRLSAGSGVSECAYALTFGKHEVRVEFYIRGSEQKDSKNIYDRLFESEEEIEKRFGADLVWERLDGKKACRIQHSKKFDGYNEDNWQEMIEWLCVHAQKLESAFRPEINKIKKIPSRIQ